MQGTIGVVKWLRLATYHVAPKAWLARPSGRIAPRFMRLWGQRLACQVRYLSSAGIQPAEIKGVQALANAFPDHWLLYASLNCYPPNQHPIEIDVLLVTDDRVLLLELKHWRGTITSTGDIWFAGTTRKGRSPVAVTADKARKVKGLLGRRIPPLAKVSVDFRVVLTGAATFDQLSDDERKYCWDLATACRIGGKHGYNELLPRVTLTGVRPCMLVRDFERVVGDARLFTPREHTWDGYAVEEENIFVHPRGVWTEHRAQQERDGRVKALLRLWNFAKLPPGLNTADTRRLVSDREAQVVAHLRDANSWLIHKSAVLAPVAPPQDEILTQHHELLSVQNSWAPLRRYLARQRDSLSNDQLLDLVMTLVNVVAELHEQGIAHRDLAATNVWVSDPTRLGVTGFMSSQMPELQSVSDWLGVLRGYGDDLPEDAQNGADGTGRHRDVHSLGRIAKEIFCGESAGGEIPDWAPSGLSGWLDKALAASPRDRWDHARDMAEALGELVAERPLQDQSRLDTFEVDSEPLERWPPSSSSPQKRGAKLVWESAASDGSLLVVKVWPQGRRHLSAETDMALLTMLEGGARLRSSPVSGLPHVEACGLALMGAFIVIRRVEGEALSRWRPSDDLKVAACIEQICLSVQALHDLGLTHADLSPENVVVSTEGDLEATIIDLFDLPASGRGRVRNLSYAPENWELLSDRQLDAFAVAKMAHELVSTRTNSVALHNLLRCCQSELERPKIETLEPILDAARAVLRTSAQGAVDSIAVAGPRLIPSRLETPEGLLWVGTRKEQAGATHYSVSSHDKRLSFVAHQNVLTDFRVEALSFQDLERRSAQTTVPLRLEIRRASQAAGFSELANKISETSPRDGRRTKSDVPASNIQIEQLWARMVELEEELAPRLHIKGRATPNVERSAAYLYETDTQFDFDSDSDVEVRTLIKGRQKRVGLLDLDRLTETQLVISNQIRALEPGEVVTLVDRRAQASLDRRRRAVTRILRRESHLPALIEFFEPRLAKSPLHYDLSASDETLERYGLNKGQLEAFRRILNLGPVGLLQGPPGTGKTRFIAALTHWLVTKGGARKVLIASQSHEAVNGAAEEVVKMFRSHGDRLDLLRIGARGLSDRLRPFHTTSLREGYEQRFLGSLKARLSAAAAAVGIGRTFMHALVDFHQEVCVPGEKLQRIRATLDEEELEPIEARRLSQRERQLSRELATSAAKWLERDVESEELGSEQVKVEGQLKLLEKNKAATVADLNAGLKIIQLGREWVETLRSGHRNFDEFLAKTRTVVTGTCVGLGQTRVRLEATSFDWVIVDEAARCTSSEIAVPLQLGRRVLLVGDHLQLPPTLTHELESAISDQLPALSEEERRRSDFERAFTSSYGSAVGEVLTEQYRMLPPICDLVSTCFYRPHGVTLQTSPRREPDRRFEGEVPCVFEDPILWIDTSALPDGRESRQGRQKETWNPAEVAVVLQTLTQICEAREFASKFNADEDPAIGVICMYKLQKIKVEQAFSERPFPEWFRRMVKIDTVDAYQGKQNKIVIVSLVRNNQHFQSGHVGTPNRCNVAFSRAQERLVVIGAREMWSSARCRSPLRQVLNLITGDGDQPALGAVRTPAELF